MAKRSYLSDSARRTMINKTFPGHSGKPDYAAPSHQMVKDGLWTGRPDNSNHTRVERVIVPTVAFTQAAKPKSLGITTPNHKRYVRKAR